MLKQVLLVFAVVCVGYFSLFSLIERSRGRKGPWEITFTSDTNGAPMFVVDQEYLGIRGKRVVFQGQKATNPTVRLSFKEARQFPFAAPVGQCVFLDTSVLPGTVTLRAYGHEIELIPRTLIVDHEEYSWRSQDSVWLTTPRLGN
jgi:hypothetical protein